MHESDIKTERVTLSDASYVWNVTCETDTGKTITFGCKDEASAAQLEVALEEALKDIAWIKT